LKAMDRPYLTKAIELPGAAFAENNV
jgi:hypothetical protein